MSYYTDLDNDLGMIEQADEDHREYEYQRRQKQSAFNRAVKAEVARQLKAAGVGVKSTAVHATATKTIVESTVIRGMRTSVNCKCCGVKFEARVADVKRGWGKYCSKSCKAKRQQRNL